MGRRKATRKQKRKEQNKTNNKVNNMNKQTNFKTTTKTTWKSAPSKADCHTGQEIVFTTTSGIDVYGGGRNRAGGWWKAKPVPQLAMGPSETMTPFNKSALSGSTVVPEGWSCDKYVGRIDPPLLISMDFPDFGVPQVQDLFWYALCDDIVENNIKSVSTQCAGGHGRTGVQLAILYYLLNDDMVRSSITSASQLIELIRDLHCHHAVETNEQQKYIARVCDIEVGPSVIVDRYAGYSWNGGGGQGKVSTKPTVTSYDYNEKYDWPPVKGGDDDDLFAPELTDDICECCGNETFDMKIEACYECQWELPTNDENLCYACGSVKPSWAFLSPNEEECINCCADALKVKATSTEVTCSKCNKLRPQDMVCDMGTYGFQCLTCVNNVKVKELV